MQNLYHKAVTNCLQDTQTITPTAHHALPGYDKQASCVLERHATVP